VKFVNTFLHILELLRELTRPGALKEWRRIDPRDEEKLLKLPAPSGASCYPYHSRLDREQVVYEEDFS
jgi:hypothetical protein